MLLEQNVSELNADSKPEKKQKGNRHEQYSGSSSSHKPWWHAHGRLLQLLLIHEVWLLLQHTNVLLNVFCQRLDRSYGTHLLKQRRYWVIAGQLSTRAEVGHSRFDACHLYYLLMIATVT